MTQTYKDYKNSSGSITKTQVVDFSLFDNYDIFQRTHCPAAGHKCMMQFADFLFLDGWAILRIDAKIHTKKSLGQTNCIYNIKKITDNLLSRIQFVTYWLLQNGTKKNQHQESHQRKSIHDNFAFVAKFVRQKANRVNKYVYVCKWNMRWRNFCAFSLVTKNVNSRSKITFFFQMSTILNFISKKKNTEENYFHYTNKKDTISYLSITFTLKHGQNTFVS